LSSDLGLQSQYVLIGHPRHRSSRRTASCSHDELWSVVVQCCRKSVGPDHGLLHPSVKAAEDQVPDDLCLGC
jgi:hypothetical protein